MHIHIPEIYKQWLIDCNDFINASILPNLVDSEEARKIPREILRDITKQGYFPFPGNGHTDKDKIDHIQYGLFCRAVGRISSSMLSLITVNTMVARVLDKWGNAFHKKRWTQKLAGGECVAAFAITEPLTGSDAANPQVIAQDKGEYWEITGTKTWISAGQIADLFLISANIEQKICCFFIERDRPGISVKPINHIDGFRAAMLAEINFDNVKIPKSHLVGAVGTGFSIIINDALNYGRFCIAWGALGLAEAALDKVRDYTNTRLQFGKRLIEHPLIQRTMTQMICNVRAAGLSCMYCSNRMNSRHPDRFLDINIAKYLTAETANIVANKAMHLHGASGLGDKDLQRYKRDAQVILLIEGSREIQEMLIPRLYAQSEYI